MLLQILNGQLMAVIILEHSKNRALEVHVGDPFKVESRNIWHRKRASAASPRSARYRTLPKNRPSGLSSVAICLTTAQVVGSITVIKSLAMALM